MDSVSILMSTYNGEKYLKEQVESLLNQIDIEVKIFVRDDGSSDGTLELLKDYERQGKISLKYGKNYGYGKSFMSLLKGIPKETEYYAFCDQDDIWLPDKMKKSIMQIKGKREPALYCALPQYVNKNMEKVKSYHSIIDDIPFGNMNVEWALVMQLFGIGCTMVWNKQLSIILDKADYSNFYYGHDNLLSILGVFVGTVYRSDEKLILYRQHGNNIGSNKELKRKPINFFQAKLRNFNNENGYKLRCFIREQFGNYILDINKRILLDYSIDYRKSLKKKCQLLSYRCSRGLNFRERLKYFLLVLFNRY